MAETVNKKTESQGPPGGVRKKRGRRLASILDCRRALAHWIRELEADRLDPGKAAKLGFLVSLLIGAIRDTELERRLEALEQAQAAQGRQP